MNKVNWVQVAIFGIVALLVLLIVVSFLPFGWRGGWGPGGMMGPGMMGGWGGWGFSPFGWIGMIFMWLFPLGFLVLLIPGGVWLFRQVTQQGPAAGPPPAISGKACPSCSKPVQTDWQLCPYCGQELT
ncbi:zinc ribbon domain-containing protein [Candidatus Hakubella thermalkaliphila]|uniref:Putative zinc-ribbon domain-containing protein n=1 Tax=Candidatus Hakubella thermalkaliphila TaxID=2754717 RepID=A0A6V8PEF3_9ACTN|nr:zinc ribbon domain-containing protein [Candidatus Hakubella thermalkaliphila]GFP31105.1 hypothetical protein HKBW3S34_02024 [Candidatus Hakubella thermalkaliphila]GFP40182.1 hypothetical protein HKBW3S47_01879 [Candidatus Hakubella thermalkaliphila]